MKAAVSRLAAKYAGAIFALAQEAGRIEATESDLVLVEETVAGHEELRRLVYHPRVPPEAKKKVLGELFGSRVAAPVRNFLFLLVDKRREAVFPAIVGEYRRLANEARNIVEAEVTAAFPLTEDQERALAARLGEVTGRNVALRVRTDKGLIGGIVVKLGDKLLDGSVVRRLKELEAALLRAGLAKGI